MNAQMSGQPKTGPVSAPTPPQPKMFSGTQGLTIVLVLTLAVVGWVLYFYEWQNKPIDDDSTENEVVVNANTNTNATANTNTTNTNEPLVYTPITKQYSGQAIALPTPSLKGTLTVEETMQSRRSVREYSETALTSSQLGQMLWAAQGITDATSGGRTAPSGHSLYPFNLYVVVRNVTGVTPGLYHYLPESHSIRQLIASDNLLEGEKQQPSVKVSPAILVYGGILKKAMTKYTTEASATKVINQESGHIAENVYLQAESIGLGTVVIGGYDPAGVKTELSLPEDESVVYLQPFGLPKEE